MIFSFNFEGKIEIKNNIFGLVFKGTRIMKIPSGIFLTNSTNSEILENEPFILKNENVSLYFENHEKYIQKDYIIEYAYVLEKPNYELYNSYAIINPNIFSLRKNYTHLRENRNYSYIIIKIFKFIDDLRGLFWKNLKFYCSFINRNLGNNHENENTYFKCQEYIGKYSDFTIKISDELITSWNSDL